MTSFNAPFQIIDQRHWNGGEINGHIGLIPCRDFVISPNETTNAVSILCAGQGSGKTTIETL